MIGGAQATADKVESLLNEWVPSDVHDHEQEYQKELQQYLDERLNEARGPLESSEEYVVSTERGRSNGDVVVNDVVGIELKRDLSNSMTDRLVGQIQKYSDEYDYVFVVACGIEDMDGWRRLKNEYEQRGLDPMEMDKAPVVFIHKKESTFGAASGGSSQGAMFGGGGGGASTGGGDVDIDAVVADGIRGIRELRADEETEMSKGEAMVAVLQLAFVVVVAIVLLIVVAQILL